MTLKVATISDLTLFQTFSHLVHAEGVSNAGGQFHKALTCISKHFVWAARLCGGSITLTWLQSRYQKFQASLFRVDGSRLRLMWMSKRPR